MRDWITTTSRGLLTLFAAIALVSGIACETPPRGRGNPLPPPDSNTSTEYFRAGDKITVILTDFPGGPAQYEQQIADNGSITLHLNQAFVAANRTRSQLQDEIHQRYVPSYYQRMTVVVRPLEQFFFVQGEVRAQNRYPFSSGMTVLKAITTAGGFTPFADERNVTITRGNGRQETVDCKRAKDDPRLDLLIYPGDQIEVPRRFI